MVQRLIETDWGQEWIDVQRRRKHVDKSSEWDKRAPSFTARKGRSDYVPKFLAKLDVRPGQTVLDMGCGDGAIAIPLAQAGVKVLACDFSGGMLSALHDKAKAAGVEIETRRMAWEDDWEACGVAPGSVDVVLSSRSLITADLKDSLQKMSRTARIRCCASVSTGSTPRMAPEYLYSMGVTAIHAYDFRYAWNILVQEGYLPEVSYIRSKRNDIFGSRDEVREKIEGILEHSASYISEEDLARARANLDRWIDEHLVALDPGAQDVEGGTAAGAGGGVRLDVDRSVDWAFISWNVGE